MFDSAVETQGQRIRKLREAKGWSLGELAKRAGMRGNAGIWQIETDKVKKPYSLSTIAAALGTTVEYLRNGEQQRESPAGIAPTVYLPVPEWRADIRASHWVEIPICGGDSDDPKQMALRQLGRFRLVVVGTCMEPLFYDGDRVEFRIIEWGEETLIPGAPYAICKTDGQASFKLFDHDEQDALIFRAANPKYTDLLRVPVQEIGRIAIAEGVFKPRNEARSDDAQIAANVRALAARREMDPLEMIERMKDLALNNHKGKNPPHHKKRRDNVRR